MGEVKRRKVHTPEFKAKVALDAMRGMKSLNEIGQEYGVHLACRNMAFLPNFGSSIFGVLKVCTTY